MSDTDSQMVTDPHNELEMIMEKGRGINRRGGPARRPVGRKGGSARPARRPVGRNGNGQGLLADLCLREPMHPSCTERLYTQLGTGGKVNKRRMQNGGLLRGPSHERGGIPAKVPGQPPIELEGGEYIINEKTTKAVGTEFLDKLNRTASPYHKKPGFPKGQLPQSNYERGGRVPKKKMVRGGKPSTPRKMVRGGEMMEDPDWKRRHRRRASRRPGPLRRGKQMGGMVEGGSCPPGQHMMPNGTCMQGEYHGAPANGNGYNRDGKLQEGGIPQQGKAKWVYYGTRDSYHGHVIQIEDKWFTTTSGTIEGNRKQVEPNVN